MNEFYISQKDWNKVINYSQSAWDEYKSEIGGMLIAEEDKDGDWKMHSPVILKQKVSAANTHLDKDELSKYYVKEAMKRKNKRMQFVWWHSHHTMSAFWSGTDLSTIDEFSEGDMSLSLVVNLKEEYKFRVNIWKPIQMHQDIEINILKADRKVPNSITNEVKELCNKETIITNYRYSKPKQLNVFPLNSVPDDEYNLLSDLVDNIYQDYRFGVSTFPKLQKDIEILNKKLNDNKSELRVGVINDPSKASIVAHGVNVDKLIHRKGDSFDVEDLLIEFENEQYDWWTP